MEALESMNTVLNTNPSGFWIDMNENSNFIAGERHINGTHWEGIIIII
jgi:hypothetical protein